MYIHILSFIIASRVSLNRVPEPSKPSKLELTISARPAASLSCSYFNGNLFSGFEADFDCPTLTANAKGYGGNCTCGHNVILAHPTLCSYVKVNCKLKLTQDAWWELFHGSSIACQHLNCPSLPSYAQHSPPKGTWQSPRMITVFVQQGRRISPRNLSAFGIPEGGF
jgi:hypothetical protein